MTGPSSAREGRRRIQLRLAMLTSGASENPPTLPYNRRRFPGRGQNQGACAGQRLKWFGQQLGWSFRERSPILHELRVRIRRRVQPIPAAIRWLLSLELFQAPCGAQASRRPVATTIAQHDVESYGRRWRATELCQ